MLSITARRVQELVISQKIQSIVDEDYREYLQALRENREHSRSESARLALAALWRDTCELDDTTPGFLTARPVRRAQVKG